MTQQHANPEDFDLYALGALDGEEKQTFEAHLHACPACVQRLAEARRQTSLLGLTAAPVTPPPALKAALMKRVHAEGRAAMDQKSAVQVRKKSWGLRFSLSFAAAAVILALATFLLGKQYLLQRQQIDRLQLQLQAAQSLASQNAAAMHAYADVVGAPDTVSITLQQQSGASPGQAHVLFNARMGLALYSGLISPAPSDKSYQLWLVPSSGAPVSAGLVAANQQGGPIVARFQPGLAAAAFAVTLEPHGGSPQPTGAKVLVGTV
jgi:anti-sigma-K factor RskA